MTRSDWSPMASDVQEKISEYLDALPERVQRALAEHIQVAIDAGEQDPAIILLHRALEGIASTPHIERRTHLLMRAFFRPIQNFLVDHPNDFAIPGRVNRASLEPIWNWMTRDVLPEKFPHGPADPPDMQKLTDSEFDSKLDELRDGLLSGAEALLEAAAQEQIQQQKLQAQLGGETAFRDCQALLSFYRHREQIDAFRRELPEVITKAHVGKGTPITDLLTRSLTNAPNLAPWFFVEFLHRLEDSTALIMMLSEMAGDDSPDTWETEPVATGLELVLFEIELLTARVHEHVADGARLVETARLTAMCHDWLKKFQIAVDVAQSPPLARRIASIKVSLSADLSYALRDLPAELRAMMKAESTDSEVDPMRRLHQKMQLFDVVRSAADSLAMNDVVSRHHRVIEQCFESQLDPLMDRVRSASTADRNDLVERLDTAIDIAELMFGAEYANLLRRSRNNALRAA